LADDPKDNEIEPSNNPVHISDFHITAAQVGLTTDDEFRPSIASQNNIAHEYANLMAEKQRKQREFIEERRQKRIRAFDSGQISSFGGPVGSFRQPYNNNPNGGFTNNSNRSNRRGRNRNKKAKLAKETTTSPSNVNTASETSPTHEESIPPADCTNSSTSMETTQ
jgi:hypothetical protein